MKAFIEPAQFSAILHQYINNPCFLDECLIPANPYKRHIRKNDIKNIDFTKPITIEEIYSNKSLIINRLLLNIYEQDLLFLGASFKNEETFQDFKSFYDPHFVALGKILKPTLEHLAFDFLKNEIEVIGCWNKENLLEYLPNVIAKQELENSKLAESILSSLNPAIAAKILLIQMAPDFLTEASAMARNLLGSFGNEQSELMKIFIDEYGYGVHNEKHSTLFENTLISAKLSPNIHHYYNDYLPSSLMLVNYFHYICSNRSEWFKYIGALYYTEASIPHFNVQISATLKKCIPGIDTLYFDEHVHIDKHHRRMALEKIIIPSIDKYGEGIIDEILSGFESFRLLQAYADEDVIRQIQFIDKLNKKKNEDKFDVIGGLQFFNEVKGEITSAHLHSEDEFFQIKNGELTFYTSILSPINLKKNDIILIPKGRLHSTVAISDKTSYMVQSIKFDKARI